MLKWRKQWGPRWCDAGFWGQCVYVPSMIGTVFPSNAIFFLHVLCILVEWNNNLFLCWNLLFSCRLVSEFYMWMSLSLKFWSSIKVVHNSFSLFDFKPNEFLKRTMVHETKVVLSFTLPIFTFQIDQYEMLKRCSGWGEKKFLGRGSNYLKLLFSSRHKTLKCRLSVLISVINWQMKWNV